MTTPPTFEATVLVYKTRDGKWAYRLRSDKSSFKSTGFFSADQAIHAAARSIDQAGNLSPFASGRC